MLSDLTADQFGQMVRNGRQRLGLSQLQLSRLAKIDRPYLCNIERGKVDPARLSWGKVAALLDRLGIASSELAMAPPEFSRLPGLAQFLQESQLPPDVARMLAGIELLGERAQTADQWRLIYHTLQGIITPAKQGESHE